MLVSARMREFWDKISQDEKDEILKSRPKHILIAGNGLTRLADLRTPSQSLSWEGWVRNCWKYIDPPLPFSYATLRGLTLPECITYLDYALKFKNLPPDEYFEKKRYVYHNLWTRTEEDSSPSKIHFECIRHFNTIITTNYDTLFERASKKSNYTTDVMVVGAKDASFNVRTICKGSQDRRLIIKLHGSFDSNWISVHDKPMPDTFNNWYDRNKGEDLIASVRSYRSRDESTEEVVKKIGGQFPGAPVIILGYGMLPEDDLIIQLIEYHFRSSIRIAMTFGGDEIDDYRRAQLNIKHLSIPATWGGDRTNWIAAHQMFLRLISTGSVFDSDSPVNPSRALMLGQASVNFIVGLNDAPLQERSYRILADPLVPPSEGRKELESRQIGGQVLVPVTFMDRWDVATAFGSVIGFDEFGLQIRNHLSSLHNVDWNYVLQKNPIITDHSYAIVFRGVRTLLDCGTSQDDKVAAEAVLENIETAIAAGLLKPKIVYLSKWFLGTVAPHLGVWCSDPHTRPLVAYETGTRGEIDPYTFEAQISDYCDVPLTSSLFAMRIARVPLYEPGKFSDSPLGFSATDPLPKWDDQFGKFQPKDTENRAYQNVALALGLRVMGITEFHKRLFQSPFANARWWTITLGEGGMLVLSRDISTSIFWLRAPKVTVRNALGCGDVARAGFLTYFAKSGLSREEFLSVPDRVPAAVKAAVAAGSLKAQYFRLEDAVRELTWDVIRNTADLIESLEMTESTDVDKLVKHFGLS